MNKANQTNDAENQPIGMCVNGTVAREHKAAKINGHKSGNEEKPMGNGTR